MTLHNTHRYDCQQECNWEAQMHVASSSWNQVWSKKTWHGQINTYPWFSSWNYLMCWAGSSVYYELPYKYVGFITSVRFWEISSEICACGFCSAGNAGLGLIQSMRRDSDCGDVWDSYCKMLCRWHREEHRLGMMTCVTVNAVVINIQCFSDICSQTLRWRSVQTPILFII